MRRKPLYCIAPSPAYVSRGCLALPSNYGSSSSSSQPRTSRCGIPSLYFRTGVTGGLVSFAEIGFELGIFLGREGRNQTFEFVGNGQGHRCSFRLVLAISRGKEILLSLSQALDLGLHGRAFLLPGGFALAVIEQKHAKAQRLEPRALFLVPCPFREGDLAPTGTIPGSLGV